MERRGKLYVIIDKKSEAYGFLHENKKEISFEFKVLEDAMKFTHEEIKKICVDFKDRLNGAYVKEVDFSLGRNIYL